MKSYIFYPNFIISSCGGGGGGGGSDPVPIPFSLTLGLFSFSVNEDETYNGSVNASANETVTLEYLITSQPSNGNVQLTSHQVRYHIHQNLIILDQINLNIL